MACAKLYNGHDEYDKPDPENYKDDGILPDIQNNEWDLIDDTLGSDVCTNDFTLHCFLKNLFDGVTFFQAQPSTSTLHVAETTKAKVKAVHNKLKIAKVKTVEMKKAEGKMKTVKRKDQSKKTVDIEKSKSQ